MDPVANGPAGDQGQEMVREAALEKAPQLRALSFADIQALDTLGRRLIPVPEWGENVGVWIWELDGATRDRWEAGILALGATGGRGGSVELDAKFKLEEATVSLVSLAARTSGDPDARLLFDNREKVRVLGEKSARAVRRLYDAARALSGIGDQDVEELAANFTNAQNGATTSA
jgi:hypothetical protein